jgi:hypothetical protein
MHLVMLICGGCFGADFGFQCYSVLASPLRGLLRRVVRHPLFPLLISQENLLDFRRSNEHFFSIADDKMCK